MNIYISGKVTGLPFEEVKERFDDAQALLEEIGFQVVNPLNNGLSFEADWQKHMVKDIELLFQCDAIYMMNNWEDSLGASIEYDIARRMNKVVYHEGVILSEKLFVQCLQRAIYEVLHLRFGDYSSSSRKTNNVNARMIYVHHLRERNVSSTVIAKQLQREHASVLYLAKKYNDYLQFSPEFRNIAINVQDVLNDILAEVES